MSGIFGISPYKINLFPSLRPYRLPEPVSFKINPNFGINNKLSSEIKAYVANANRVRYYFREALAHRKFIAKF